MNKYQDIAVIARTNKELVELCEDADRVALAGGMIVPMEMNDNFFPATCPLHPDKSWETPA